MGNGDSTVCHRAHTQTIAPEVAERIIACHTAGESLSKITGRLHMTPAEVRAVLGARQAAAEVAAPIRVPHSVGVLLIGAVEAGAQAGGGSWAAPSAVA